MNKLREVTLKGVIPALITPMTEGGEINFPFLEKQVAYLSQAGVHGFFVCGTTGEGAYLTTPEKLAIFKVVREVSGGRQFLCAASLRPSTAMVLEEMFAFEKLEPDFFVAVTPFYGSVSQDTIAAHYRRIAQNSAVPLILYNIPGCTHNTLALDTILKLSSEQNICGIKDSSGNFISFSRGLLSETPPGFSWIQGEDYLDGPSLLNGSRGMVTGLGNVWIEPYLQMYSASARGDQDSVRKYQKKINQLYEIIRTTEGKAIAAVKAGVSCLGRSEKYLRLSEQTLFDL